MKAFQSILREADGHVHQAEHRVFEFDGVQTLLPVPHGRVDVEPGGGVGGGVAEERRTA